MDALLSSKQVRYRHALVIVALIAVGIPTVAVEGSIVDLTDNGGANGVVNGAIFQWANLGGGTGNIEPFVRLRATGSEQGYNTSNAALPFDAKPGQWTHDLQLNQIPIIEVNGIDYFEFVLDVNESGSSRKSFISLDEVQIFTSTTPSQNTTNISSLGDLRYNLDFGEDSVVLMDANQGAGSGVIDMTAFIPVSAFAGANATDYVYFYSAFGTTGFLDSRPFTTEGGFEEWAVQIDENSVFIPSPGALALLAVSLFTVRPRRRRGLA